MQTYFLVGKEGFYKTLPNPADYEESSSKPAVLAHTTITASSKGEFLQQEDCVQQAQVISTKTPLKYSASDSGVMRKNAPVSADFVRPTRTGAVNETDSVQREIRQMAQRVAGNSHSHLVTAVNSEKTGRRRSKRVSTNSRNHVYRKDSQSVLFTVGGSVSKDALQAPALDSSQLNVPCSKDFPQTRFQNGHVVVTSAQSMLPADVASNAESVATSFIGRENNSPRLIAAAYSTNGKLTSGPNSSGILKTSCFRSQVSTTESTAGLILPSPDRRRSVDFAGEANLQAHVFRYPTAEVTQSNNASVVVRLETGGLVNQRPLEMTSNIFAPIRQGLKILEGKLRRSNSDRKSVSPLNYGQPKTENTEHRNSPTNSRSESPKPNTGLFKEQVNSRMIKALEVTPL